MDYSLQTSILKSKFALTKNAEHDQKSHGNRDSSLEATKVSGGASSMQALARNNVSLEGSQHARDEVESALLSQASQKYVVWNGNKIVAAVAFGVNDSNVTSSIELHHIGSVRSSGGKALMNKVKSFALRKKLPIRVNIHEDAKGFYEAQGFKQIDGTLYEYRG